MLKNLTATRLAAELDHVRDYDPQYTGPLSMLDEATGYWAQRYPELAAAQKSFSDARYHQKDVIDRRRNGDPKQAWADVVTTAATLAEALRPLGYTSLEYCEQQSTYGWRCTGVLNDGRCPYADDHAN
jgi:hypothetical protein